jgi:Peroxiredoxin
MIKKIALGLFCMFSICAFAQEVTEAESEKFMQLVAPAQQKIFLLEQEVSALTEEELKDESIVGSIQQKYEIYMEELGDLMIRYAREEPSSSISLEIVAQLLPAYNINLMDSLFLSLAPELRASQLGKKTELQLTNMKKTPIGGIAPDFSQKDPDGEIIHLSDYRGKYVLVDFWASWCGPCRKENPHVVKAYNEFKDKNFDILGISLDNNKTSWTNAIRKDGLEWRQVSDLKKFDNEVAALYGVFSIPQNFLIDPNGVIVAKNLRGEQLIKKLSEILK